MMILKTNNTKIAHNDNETKLGHVEVPQITSSGETASTLPKLSEEGKEGAGVVMNKKVCMDVYFESY